MLPLCLGFTGCLALILLLITSVGLLAGVLAMSANWPIASFFWVSLGYLLILISYYSHVFIALFLGFPRPIYCIFTFYHSYRLVGHHSCHVNPLSLSLYFLGFFCSFTYYLPFIVPMSLPLYFFGFLGPLTSFFFFFYLLLFSWVCWPSFLPCHPIGFVYSSFTISPFVFISFPLLLSFKTLVLGTRKRTSYPPKCKSRDSIIIIKK